MRSHALLAPVAPVALAASLLGLAAPAGANGRFPAAGQIVIDPSVPDTVIVRATYGILKTSDHGGQWDWICEGAVGYGGFEDPSMGLTGDGTILAGVFDGLSVSHDGGCGWGFEKQGLDGKFIVDVSVAKNASSHAIVLASNGTSADTFLTQVWRSSDDAQTWQQAGIDLPIDVVGVTLDSAPSNEDILYVTGRKGAPDYLGVLERSDDGGQTWVETLIPGADATSSPFLSAIDPLDPDVVYVRLDGDPVDTLVVSKDGGKTFDVVFESTGMLLGFALSPDGSRVAVGGTDDGVWLAPNDNLAFEKVSDVGVRCFYWTARGLYACGDQFVDGFTVGLSKDEGKTFETLMQLADLCGPLACPSESENGQICPGEWLPTRATIGANCGEPEVDAGVPGASTSGPGLTETGGSSCAYQVPAGATGGAACVAVVGLLAAAGARRRLRRNAAGGR